MSEEETMNLLFNIKLLLCILAVMFTFTNSHAHALKETTARITLRDGQVKVRIQANLQAWEKHLQDDQAWLTGQVDQIMPKNLLQQQRVNFLKELLINQTQLKINGEKIAFESVSFPQKILPSHNHYSDIVLTSRHANTLIKNLTVQFPKTLGAVYSSLIRPEYRLIKAGQPASLLNLN